MRHYIVVPVYNEEKFLINFLESIVSQTVFPEKIVFVNDNSSDNSESIIVEYIKKYSFISIVHSKSDRKHMPGSKVIEAFYKGFETLDDNYELITKLDADIILPQNYLQTISKTFKTNANIGISGGVCYEKNKHGEWKLNHPMEKWHVRGAIKTYSKECFKVIGGIKKHIGWDTVDELLAIHYGFKVFADNTLSVKHCRPTGSAYHPKAMVLQGEAMYRMRYRIILTLIATLKMCIANKNIYFLYFNLKGYISSLLNKKTFIVNYTEGLFIRRFRYKNIIAKIINLKTR